MDGAAVEEQRVTRLHPAGECLLAFWRGNKVCGEGFGSVGRFWAGDLLIGRVGDEIHPPVLGIGVVDGGPCRHAGLRLHQEVEIILMHRLTA